VGGRFGGNPAQAQTYNPSRASGMPHSCLRLGYDRTTNPDETPYNRIRDVSHGESDKTFLPDECGRQRIAKTILYSG